MRFRLTRKTVIEKSIISRLLLLSKCFGCQVATSFLLVFSLLISLPAGVSAATLADLPFGSVIQIQPKDTYMLDCAYNQADCQQTTDLVKPFRFVKMQARGSDGAALGDANGVQADGTTYWAFLDNYCWWGSANCRYSTNQPTNN